jgi:hypothetical protein
LEEIPRTMLPGDSIPLVNPNGDVETDLIFSVETDLTFTIRAKQCSKAFVPIRSHRHCPCCTIQGPAITILRRNVRRVANRSPVAGMHFTAPQIEIMEATQIERAVTVQRENEHRDHRNRKKREDLLRRNSLLIVAFIQCLFSMRMTVL